MSPDVSAIESALDAARTFRQTADFLESRAFTDCLTTIGDNSTKAAQYALRRAQTAKDRTAAVRSVITHLEAAHTAYYEIYRSVLEPERRSVRTALRSSQEEQAAALKDIWVLVLLALCDRYVGEPDNMTTCLDDLRKAYIGYSGGHGSFKYHVLGQHDVDTWFDSFEETSVGAVRWLARPIRSWRAAGETLHIDAPEWRDVTRFCEDLSAGQVGQPSVPASGRQLRSD